MDLDDSIFSGPDADPGSDFGIPVAVSKNETEISSVSQDGDKASISNLEHDGMSDEIQSSNGVDENSAVKVEPRDEMSDLTLTTICTSVAELSKKDLSLDFILSDFVPTKNFVKDMETLDIFLCGKCESIYHVIEEFKSHLLSCSTSSNNTNSSSSSTTNTNSSSGSRYGTENAIALSLWTTTIKRHLASDPKMLSLSIPSSELTRKIHSKWSRLPKRVKKNWVTTAKCLKDLSSTSFLFGADQLEKLILEREPCSSWLVEDDLQSLAKETKGVSDRLFPLPEPVDNSLKLSLRNKKKSSVFKIEDKKEGVKTRRSFIKSKMVEIEDTSSCQTENKDEVENGSLEIVADRFNDKSREREYCVLYTQSKRFAWTVEDDIDHRLLDNYKKRDTNESEISLKAPLIPKIKKEPLPRGRPRRSSLLKGKDSPSSETPKPLSRKNKGKETLQVKDPVLATSLKNISKLTAVTTRTKRKSLVKAMSKVRQWTSNRDEDEEEGMRKKEETPSSKRQIRPFRNESVDDDENGNGDDEENQTRDRSFNVQSDLEDFENVLDCLTEPLAKNKKESKKLEIIELGGNGTGSGKSMGRKRKMISTPHKSKKINIDLLSETSSDEEDDEEDDWNQTPSVSFGTDLPPGLSITPLNKKNKPILESESNTMDVPESLKSLVPPGFEMIKHVNSCGRVEYRLKKTLCDEPVVKEKFRDDPNESGIRTILLGAKSNSTLVSPEKETTTHTDPTDIFNKPFVKLTYKPSQDELARLSSPELVSSSTDKVEIYEDQLSEVTTTTETHHEEYTLDPISGLLVDKEGHPLQMSPSDSEHSNFIPMHIPDEDENEDEDHRDENHHHLLSNNSSLELKDEENNETNENTTKVLLVLPGGQMILTDLTEEQCNQLNIPMGQDTTPTLGATATPDGGFQILPAEPGQFASSEPSVPSFNEDPLSNSQLISIAVHENEEEEDSTTNENDEYRIQENSKENESSPQSSVIYGLEEDGSNTSKAMIVSETTPIL